MKNFRLTFINYASKDIFNINVKSTIADAYIHEHGHLEEINTYIPNIDWLTFLAEKKTTKNLKGHSLETITLIK